jgi:hypothetical protein
MTEGARRARSANVAATRGTGDQRGVRACISARNRPGRARVRTIARSQEGALRTRRCVGTARSSVCEWHTICRALLESPNLSGAC